MQLMVYSYIGDRGQRFRVDRIEWETFDSVYQRRPQGFRYVVCLAANMPEYRYDYVVFDLLDARIGAATIEKPALVEPGKRWKYDDLDAAVAATILTYGVEHGS